MEKITNKVAAMCLLGLAVSAAYAQVLPEHLTSTVTNVSVWKGGTDAANTTGQKFGQSFIASSPFITSIAVNIGVTTGTLTCKIYAFNSDADPTGAAAGLPYWVAEGTADIAQFGSSVCKNWRVPVDPNAANPGLQSTLPYLKVGSKYYVEFTKANSSIHFYFSKTNQYPQGDGFIDGQIIQHGGSPTDINIVVEGGYPKIASKALNVLSSWKDGNDAWNARGLSAGQTFIATTTHINSITLNAGNNTAGRGIVRIYKFNTQANPAGQQIGQAAYATLVPYGATQFNWQANNLPSPLLEVGKKYYVEIVHETAPNIHVYGTKLEQYSQGNSYLSRAPFTGDLNIIINGSDYTTGNQAIFSEWQQGTDAWNVNTPSAGQLFTATTSYLTDITCNAAGTGSLKFDIYEYSGNDAAPEGIKVGGSAQQPIASFAATKGIFSQPVPLVIGKMYYAKISADQPFTIYGGKNKILYPYDAAEAASNASYDYKTFLGGQRFTYANHNVNLNIVINGLSTGGQYLNNPLGASVYFNGPDVVQFDQVQALNISWIRRDFMLDEPGIIQDDALIARSQAQLNGGVVGILNWANRHELENNLAKRTIFINEAAELAKRYKGRHVIWEILNEPHEGSDPAGIFTENYRDLVIEVATAMRAQDTNVWIGAGSLSHFCYWCSNRTINQAFADAIDFYTYHPYHQTLPEKGAADWTLTRRMRMAKVASKGVIPQLFASEYGVQDSKTAYQYKVAADGVDAFNTTANSFGQLFYANSESIRSIAINTGSISGIANMNVYEYSGNPTAPKGTLLNSSPYSATILNYSKTTFYLSAACSINGGPTNVTTSPLEFKIGKLYYVEFTNPQGQLHLYLAKADITAPIDGESAEQARARANSFAYAGGQKTQYGGHPVSMNIEIEDAAIKGEGQTCEQKDAAIYNLRSILGQMQVNTSGNILYKHAEYADDHYGLYSNWFTDKPASIAVRNFGSFFSRHNAATDVQVSTPNANIVARASDTSLVLAVWKTKSAASAFKSLESIKLSSAVFSKNIKIYSDLQNTSMTVTPVNNITFIDGGLVLNNVEVGSAPIIIQIDK